jgi:tryptophan halogenase
MNRIRRVVIVGGGTAGWMAASALSATFGRSLEIDLVESSEIGTVGVGEATIPPIRNFHLLLGLTEEDFLRAVNGTYKLGIEFQNWGRLGERYFHPFAPYGTDTWAAQFHHFWVRARQQGEAAPLDDFSYEATLARMGRFGQSGDYKANYAYHFDAGLYAQLLRGISERNGVRRTEGEVVEVRREPSGGFIESVVLADGYVLSGDLFIDCSGFRGLLIEQTLETGWEDWGHWLRSDRAVAVQTESPVSPLPYTRATARSCGWQWRIPLQNRVGNGLVYSSAHLDEDAAGKLLLDNLDGRAITEPRTLRFRTGRRLRQWNRNCIALGLASGFLEPLESTSIHLVQNSIIRLIKLFPSGGDYQREIDQFNREVRVEIEHIRDFIILHYHLTARGDTAYWRECREMSVPDTLKHKLEMFAEGGKVFRDDNELFSETSWTSVMVGQGLVPRTFHPFAGTLGDQELAGLMTRVRGRIAALAGQQPLHQEYIRAQIHSDRPG